MTNPKAVRFGIAGTGFIAGVVARSIDQSAGAKLTTVSSRNQETAQAFAAENTDVVPVTGIEDLLARDDVDAVYVATPTITKESIALAAISSSKHVLIDKPFLNFDSVKRIAIAAADKGVLFMDATHFVHHPRTEAIRRAIPKLIGTPRSMHTTFYFPFSDRSNIRFDRTLEPTGAVGDMAWYSMRAVVEYLQPRQALSTVAVAVERDADTGAVIRASGLVGFESGEASTFDIGYTAGTAVMDLSLLGTDGMIAMDDFVLDWHSSFAFQNPSIETGYIHRTGMAARQDFTFIETPSDTPGDVLMIENFAQLAVSADRGGASIYSEASLKTQQYLDAIWESQNR